MLIYCCGSGRVPELLVRRTNPLKYRRSATFAHNSGTRPRLFALAYAAKSLLTMGRNEIKCEWSVVFRKEHFDEIVKTMSRSLANVAVALWWCYTAPAGDAL